MNRLNWTLVLVPLALVGLLACQSAAFGDDGLPLAPMPSDVTAAAYVPPVPTAPSVDVTTPSTPSTPSIPATAGAQGSCAWNGCGCGCDRHWVVGVEALWLAPIGNQRVAGFGIADHEGILADTSIQEEMTFSPRINFGWQGECWGVQAQYFQLHQDDPAGGYGQFGAGGVGGYGAVETAAFRCEKFDLEATRLFCCGATQFQWNGGVCYGQFDQKASLSVLEPGSGGYYNGWAMSKLDFNGVGLTTGLTALRPIGCKNLNLFCTVQLSLLWDNQPNSETQSRVTWGGDNAAADAIGQSNTSLFIGEVEAGLQWNAPLQCVPANAFFRVAFDYQYWNTTDVPEFATIVAAGPDLSHLGTAAAVAWNGHTNLVGIGIATGITF